MGSDKKKKKPVESSSSSSSSEDSSSDSDDSSSSSSSNSSVEDVTATTTTSTTNNKKRKEKTVQPPSTVTTAPPEEYKMEEVVEVKDATAAEPSVQRTTAVALVQTKEPSNICTKDMTYESPMLESKARMLMLTGAAGDFPRTRSLLSWKRLFGTRVLVTNADGEIDTKKVLYVGQLLHNKRDEMYKALCDKGYLIGTVAHIHFQMNQLRICDHDNECEPLTKLAFMRFTNQYPFESEEGICILDRFQHSAMMLDDTDLGTAYAWLYQFRRSSIFLDFPNKLAVESTDYYANGKKNRWHKRDELVFDKQKTVDEESNYSDEDSEDLTSCEDDESRHSRDVANKNGPLQPRKRVDYRPLLQLENKKRPITVESVKKAVKKQKKEDKLAAKQKKKEEGGEAEKEENDDSSSSSSSSSDSDGDSSSSDSSSGSSSSGSSSDSSGSDSSSSGDSDSDSSSSGSDSDSS